VAGAGTGAGALAAVAFVMLAAAIVTVSVLARAAAGIAGTLYFAVVAISGGLIGRALGGGVAALAVAIGAMLMARRSSARAHDFPFMSRWSTALACRGGTRFRDADLSGAHFDGASVVASDFRGARLEGTSFDGAVIRLCRFDET